MNGCASKDTSLINTRTPEAHKKSSPVEKPSHKKKISQYKSIIVSPVKVISYVEVKNQTLEQMRLYQNISDYLESEYKLIIDENPKYKLQNKESSDTLILKSEISVVQIDSKNKNNNKTMPIAMSLNDSTLKAYADENVRLLGKKSFIDSMDGRVIKSSEELQENIAVLIDGEILNFKDFQPALDAWLEQIKKDLL